MAAKVKLSKERISELKGKIEKSKEIYKHAFDEFKVDDMRIVWSAGKDSTLMLWIALEYCRENNIQVPICFTIDEFDVFEEIDAMLKVYAEKWNLRLDWGLNIDVVERSGWKLNNDVIVKEIDYKLHFSFICSICRSSKVEIRVSGRNTRSVKRESED